MQLDEIVGLQNHVVEFEERQLLVALEAHAHAVEGQHAVDREMAPDIAEELDVVELRQPLGVVDHQRIAAAIAEADEARERAPDAVLVPFDLIEGEQAPALVAAGRIADAGRAAAHQGDRLAAGLLQPMQHHDRQEMPDMQGRGRAVVAHIGGELTGPCLGVEALGIGALVDIAPLGQHGQEFGGQAAHRFVSSGWLRHCMDRLRGGIDRNAWSISPGRADRADSRSGPIFHAPPGAAVRWTTDPCPRKGLRAGLCRQARGLPRGRA